MRILISNDDGINADGIIILENVVKNLSNDIYVVAPDSNRTGAGHSMTIANPIRVYKHDDRHYSVNGSPTDSVVMAMYNVMSTRPDYVLSGINCDANLAEDISYSGTIGAALEGAIIGVPSIALSQKIRLNEDIDWSVSKKFCLDVLKHIFTKVSIPEYTILNINFPSVCVDDVKGVRITRQGKRVVQNELVESIDPWGNSYFWRGVGHYRHTDNNSDIETDLGAVNAGYISITPIAVDMTCYALIDKLREIF